MKTTARIFALLLLLPAFLAADTYRYFIKDGKKYRVRVMQSAQDLAPAAGQTAQQAATLTPAGAPANAVDPSTAGQGAEYRYVIRDGKKYRIRLKKPPAAGQDLSADPAQKPKYKYIIRNGKKYRVRLNPVKKQTPDSQEPQQDLRKKFYISLEGELRSYTSRYSFATQRLTVCDAEKDKDGFCVLTNEAHKFKFSADGKTHVFSKDEKSAGVSLNVYYEFIKNFQLGAGFYSDDVEVDLRPGLKFAPDFEIFDFNPYAELGASLNFPNFGSLPSFKLSSLTYFAGAGVFYKLDDFFLNAGLRVSKSKLVRQSQYSTDTQEITKDIRFIVGLGYMF